MARQRTKARVNELTDKAQKYFNRIIEDNWENKASWKEVQNALTEQFNNGVNTTKQLLDNSNHKVETQMEEFMDSLKSGSDAVMTKSFTRAAKEAFKEVDIDANGTVDAAEFYAGMLVLYHKINMIPWGGRKPPPKRKYVMALYDRWLTHQQEELGEESDGLTQETFIKLCREHFGEVAGSVLGRIFLVALVFPILAIWVKRFLMATPGVNKVFSPIEALLPSMLVSLFVTILPYGESLVVRRVLSDKNGFALLEGSLDEVE